MIKTTVRLLRKAYAYNQQAVLINGAITAVLFALYVFLLFKLNSVYGSLYGAIEVKDADNIYKSLGMFSGLAAVLVLVNGYAGMFSNRLAFAIRDGLTCSTLGRLDEYNVPLIGQRVQEDMKKFSEQSMDLLGSIFKAAIKLPLFLVVVANLTQWWVGATILGVVVVGTVLVHFISKKLVLLQSIQEQNEAEFRMTCARNRPTMYVDFIVIKKQFAIINNRLKSLLFAQSGFGQVLAILPFFLMMPMYINGTVTMGAFFQSVNALNKIVDALSVIIDNRQTLLNIETSASRLEFLV